MRLPPIQANDMNWYGHGNLTDRDGAPMAGIGLTHSTVLDKDAKDGKLQDMYVCLLPKKFPNQLSINCTN